MNQRAIKIFDFPPALATGAYTNKQGVALLAARGEFGDPKTRDPELTRKLALAWHSELSFRFERRRPDGTTLEVTTIQIPGGGDIRIF